MHVRLPVRLSVALAKGTVLRSEAFYVFFHPNLLFCHIGIYFSYSDIYFIINLFLASPLIHYVVLK